jgi:hypothetical protein
MADEIDTWEDVLFEVIAEERTAAMTPELQRICVAVAASGLRRAEEQGKLRELFGAGAVRNTDLEELARKILERIDGSNNPGLEAECVDFVFGMGLNDGISQTEIGKRHGVGRACASARCIKLREHFGLPPARGMKSDAARDAYSRAATEWHQQKPPPQKWAFTGLLSRVFTGGANVATGIV